MRFGVSQKVLKSKNLGTDYCVKVEPLNVNLKVKRNIFNE